MMLSLAACAHKNGTNGTVDNNHEAPRAVDRVRGATNTNAGGDDQLITNREVERTRERTNTNTNAADPK